MKNRLIVIGKNIYFNHPFMSYIERKLEDFGFIEEVIKIPEHHPETLTLLKQQLKREGQLTIIANRGAFSKVRQLLTTITDDTLKENLPTSSKSDENSFFIQHHHTTINLILAEPGHTLPSFWVEPYPKESTLHLFQMDSEEAQNHLEPLAKRYEIELSYTPLTQGWLKVSYTHTEEDYMKAFEKDVQALLPKQVIVSDNIFAYLIQRFSSLGRSVTFAESCTGGLLTYNFIKRNGASKILNGSLITYSNSLKENWLGVKNDTLEKNGAVSSEVVYEMSDGVMNVSESDYSISVSGIAGDTGGTIDKPVGTVYIGARTKNTSQAIHLELNGDRNHLQETSVLFAIKMLLLVDKDMFFKI